MNLLKFKSEDCWANAVAVFWRERLRQNPRLRLCLPSGHTPARIYEAMGRLVAKTLTSFREAEIFALDDYGGLAAEDPGRCRNMLQNQLLGRIDLPIKRFHHLDTEAPDLDKVCRDYDGLIEAGGGFDLTLLGIGLNGHLGLNEPGSSAESRTRRVEMHPATIKSSARYLAHSNLPSWGVSVGLKQLLASREIWLLACGSSKAEIVRAAMHGEVNEQVPASVLRSHPNTWLFVDAEAGALLD